jgi:hypothetical protein
MALPTGMQWHWLAWMLLLPSLALIADLRLDNKANDFASQVAYQGTMTRLRVVLVSRALLLPCHVVGRIQLWHL